MELKTQVTRVTETAILMKLLFEVVKGTISYQILKSYLRQQIRII